ncbi:hypothetical protein GURASL_08830 [Geotalea uraniireducens]|uniref:Zinc ribbon domain-containing protein n=1 Tax=Geotalea uraniireducens TaxID=351604 RepID=A0ABM8EHR6_9BACT|nr:hypothetical protein GURASL_08830 [Geotalea uraniireducens]
MALINCHECMGKVSSTALSCPKCGAPIANLKEYLATGTQLTTIQETSKRLKLHLVIGMGLFILGFAFIANGLAGLGITACVVGSLLYTFTKIRIWWHHK